VAKLSKRHSHSLFALLQSAITCTVAAAIASQPFFPVGAFVGQWISAWLLSWLVMLPLVLLLAPWLRRLTDRLTEDDTP
jgi:threonine/homoserine efflux transporter RhtA